MQCTREKEGETPDRLDKTRSFLKIQKKFNKEIKKTLETLNNKKELYPITTLSKLPYDPYCSRKVSTWSLEQAEW
jgi:hypothetical protein